MKFSIRTKIFAGFALLLVVSVSIVTWIWYAKYSGTLRNSAEDYMYRSITEANKNFELTMKDIDYISTIISLNQPNVIDVLVGNPSDSVYERLQKDRKLDNFISTLYGYKYYISSISVAGANGRSYSQGSTVPAEQFRASHWYAGMVQSRGNPVFITTHAGSDLDQVSEFPSQNVVSLARAIMSGDRQVGYVMIDFGYEVVQKMFSTTLQNGGELFLLDGKGNFVYTPQQREINRNIGDTNYAAVWQALGGSSGRRTVKIAGESYYAVYARSDYTDWTTLALAPKSKLLAASRRAANASVLVPILTLMASLLVATVLARQITRNIGALRNAMKRVGAGNLSETITIRSGDEVEELSHGFNQMVESIKLLVEDVKRTEEQKHVMEFKALQAQINPHFLFNTLNQVRWLADLQKAHNIRELVSSLLALLHSSMGKGAETVALRDEVAYVRHYLNIQEYRYYDKFEVSFDLDERIENGSILKFILQPLVENALIHGLEPLKGKGTLSLKGYLEGEDMILQVTDNGAGIPEDKLAVLFEPAAAEEAADRNKSRFSGIGLRNVQERIRLHYGDKYGLTVTSVPELFTTVTVRLPYRPVEEA